MGALAHPGVAHAWLPVHGIGGRPADRRSGGGLRRRRAAAGLRRAAPRGRGGRRWCRGAARTSVCVQRGHTHGLGSLGRPARAAPPGVERREDAVVRAPAPRPSRLSRTAEGMRPHRRRVRASRASGRCPRRGVRSARCGPARGRTPPGRGGAAAPRLRQPGRPRPPRAMGRSGPRGGPRTAACELSLAVLTPTGMMWHSCAHVHAEAGFWPPVRPTSPL